MSETTYEQSESPSPPSRRTFLRRFTIGGGLAVGGLLGLDNFGWGHGTLLHGQDLEIRQHVIPVAREKILPNNLRVVLIGDLHIMPYNLPVIQESIQQILQDPPDIVLIAGDTFEMEGPAADTFSHAQVLQPLQALQGKVFAVAGNHDYQGDIAPRPVPELGRFLRQYGIQLLDNSETIVSVRGVPVYLMGIGSRSHGDQRLTSAQIPEDVQRAMQSHVTILLAHEPDIGPAVANLPQPDLVCAAHLHGTSTSMIILDKLQQLLEKRPPDCVTGREIFLPSNSLLSVPTIVSPGIGTSQIEQKVLRYINGLTRRALGLPPLRARTSRPAVDVITFAQG